MSALSEMGVNIVENDEREGDGQESAEGEEEETSLDEGEASTTFTPTATKKETLDRTDEPVRMYLREMGEVELLSREGELAIAKRIEAGRDTIIAGTCESRSEERRGGKGCGRSGRSRGLRSLTKKNEYTLTMFTRHRRSMI